MDPVSAAVLVLFLAVPAAFTAGAFKRARAGGHLLPSREDWKPRMPSFGTRPGGPGTSTPAGGKAAAGRGKTKAGGKGRPLTVPAILAAGITDNWAARRAHLRANPRPSMRHRLFSRLVLPGGNRAGPAASPAAIPPQPGKPGGNTMETSTSSPDFSAAHPDGKRVSDVTGGSTSGGGGSAAGGGRGMTGGGAAGDFFHAQNRMLQDAASGGLKSKVRAHLALGEGFPQQASALEMYARHLQETGQYPSFVWEPVRQAAQFLHSAGARMKESGSAIAGIAATPAGELQGKAPAREELNKE